MHINMQNDVSFVGGILFAKSLGAGHLNLVLFEKPVSWQVQISHLG